MNEEEKKTNTGPTILVACSPAGADLPDRARVGDVLVIGRGKEAGLDIGDRDVSRQHVEIRREDGMYIIKDLGSKKGTFLNGRPLFTRAQLLNQAVIRMGETVLVYLENAEAFQIDRLVDIPSKFDQALSKAMEEADEELPPPKEFIKAIHYEKLILNGREKKPKSLTETADKIIGRLMSRLTPEKAVAEVFYDVYGLSTRDTADLETIRTPGPGRKSTD